MAFEDTLNSISTEPLNECFVCLKIKQTISEPGMPNQLYELIKKAFLKTLGWFVELIAKLYELIKKSVDYIIAEGLNILNEIYTKLTKFFTKTKEWVVENLSDCYNNITVPIPPFDFLFGGFSIPMPSNKAFNELSIDSHYRKPQWLNQVYVLIRFLTNMISFPIKFVLKIVSKVYDIIKEFVDVFLKTLDEMLTAIPVIINKVLLFFAGLVNPLIDLVETSLESIIGIFEASAEKITEYITIFFDWIISCITSGIASLEEALASLFSIVSDYTTDSKIIAKLNMIGRFIFCIIKALFSMAKTLLSFGWV